MTDRVVVLVDMDCFYCQVEAKLNPSLNGYPMAVVQYNQWKGGGIIAVNYEARDRGVTRSMRGTEAKKHCPEIILVSVPTIRDKADLTRYRDAGREVLSVLCRFSDCVQRASVDEAYIDLTKAVEERMKIFSQFREEKWKSTFVVGYSKTSSNDEEERRSGFKAWLEDSESISNTASLKLAVGALIVEELRETVYSETGFKCSAGIAHNKILAKLACGLHKPNRQTILPLECVFELYKTLPIKKIKNLGGKFGVDIVEKLGCKTMSDLLKFSEKELQSKYDEKNGSWLYNIAHGIDNEPVTARLLSKSIGCCKNFPGRTALSSTKDVHIWLNKLSEELSERLLEDEVMNKRRASLLTISFRLEINKKDTASSKSVALSSYEIGRIFSLADLTLRKVCKVDAATNTWHPPIKFLGLSAGKFSNTSSKIVQFFKASANSDLGGVETNEIAENNKTLTEEKNKPSFFERVLQLDVLNSSKKLNIVPDFSKNDLCIDSEDSQSSLIKAVDQNQETPDENRKENVKKKLFNSDCDSKNLDLIETSSNSNRASIKESLVDQPTVCLNEKKTVQKNTIVKFFNQNFKQDSWVKPEELFPDMSQIDDELLASLPSSYRTKILKMQQDNCENLCKSNSNTKDCDISNELTNRVVEQPIKSSNMSSSTVKCKECGEIVLNYELHQDMHLAIKLDKELNSGVQVIPNKSTSLKSVNTSKRKVQTKEKKTLKKNAKKMKSIDMFFK